MTRSQHFRTFLFAAIALLVALIPSTTRAVTPEISAELRARTEVNLHRGFPAESAGDDTLNIQSFLRTRINIDLPKDSATRIFVQLQDARTYGSAPGTSGGLSNDMNLGVHQAYIEFRHWIWSRLEARVGRQELTYGDHRLIGNVGWSNVGRTFDGAWGAVHFDKVRLEAALLTLTERDPGDGKSGSDQDDILGILGIVWPGQNMGIVFIGDADRTRVTGDERQLQRGTLSLYSARTIGEQFDYIANLAFQGGHAYVDSVEADIEAYLLALEVGMKLPGRSRARLALGIDHVSGDDGEDSTKFKAFNNLYYTGHKFRGHMDNFLAPNGLSASRVAGLTDLYARARFGIARKWQAGIDAHLFRTAVEYTSAVDAAGTKAVGTEFDFWVKATEVHGVTWQYGLSMFSASEDWVGSTAETTQWWMYSQLSVNVK